MLAGGLLWLVGLASRSLNLNDSFEPAKLFRLSKLQ